MVYITGTRALDRDGPGLAGWHPNFSTIIIIMIIAFIYVFQIKFLHIAPLNISYNCQGNKKVLFVEE